MRTIGLFTHVECALYFAFHNARFKHGEPKSDDVSYNFGLHVFIQPNVYFINNIHSLIFIIIILYPFRILTQLVEMNRLNKHKYPGAKRLMLEAQELKDNTEDYWAQPIDDNLVSICFSFSILLLLPPKLIVR